MAGDIFEENLFLNGRIAEVDEESRTHVALQIFHLGLMARAKATRDQITVFEQSTSAEFFRGFDRDQTVVEMLQGFGEVPVAGENDQRGKRDGRGETKLLDGRAVEQIEDVQQGIEQDLKRVHGELVLSFHLFDEFLKTKRIEWLGCSVDVLARDFDPRCSAERSDPSGLDRWWCESSSRCTTRCRDGRFLRDERARRAARTPGRPAWDWTRWFPTRHRREKWGSPDLERRDHPWDPRRTTPRRHSIEDRGDTAHADELRFSSEGETPREWPWRRVSCFDYWSEWENPTGQRVVCFGRDSRGIGSDPDRSVVRWNGEASFVSAHSAMLFVASMLHRRERIGDEAKFFLVNISTSRGAKQPKLNKKNKINYARESFHFAEQASAHPLSLHARNLLKYMYTVFVPTIAQLLSLLRKANDRLSSMTDEQQTKRSLSN